jgi:GDPmannose 4,6-dehydratase
MSKKALITGITGQDGSYLAEYLLDQGYEVHGIVRRVANEFQEHRFSRIKHILDKITIHSGSLENYQILFDIFNQVRPHELYHLAAQSFVANSFDDEHSTLSVNTFGTHFLISILKKINPECRFYFAATSEMFGKVLETPQNENTKFNPRSIYGISKLAGFEIVKNYRESYNIFACSGILFNHESPRRGSEFVTRKISIAAAKIKLGIEKKIILGNIDAQRDWGYAKDYVEAMHAMIQQETPNDYVIGSDETHSVKDFLECAFNFLDLDYQKYLEIDKKFFRPAEVDLLISDSSRAKKDLNWSSKTPFNELVSNMVKSDYEYFKKLK